MAFKGIFDRFSRRKEEVTENAVIGNDGWVEMAAGRLVVHDPAEDGRYATLTAEPGVRLWINDEEVTEPTAVTASDQIRYEVAVDPANFFVLQMAEDEMSVELHLTADPYHLPDTVAVVGRHQVRLQPGYSTRAKPRVGNPRQLILDHLRDMGVEYGLDEALLDRELAHPSGGPVVIARGQEAREPVMGQWVWRLDESALVEAGQVIAAYQGGQPNQPRITVKGETSRVYEDLPEPHVYLAGNGTRIVPGGRLVASASGRARAVPTPAGQRVHIFPVHRVDGDLLSDLETQADVMVFGNVVGAKVTAAGEFLVMGNVEKSEIRAEVITIRGQAGESKLCTVPPGSCVPLRAEYTWLQGRIEAMRDAIHNHRPVTEDAFREAQTFIQKLRRKAEQMGLNHPEYAAAAEELARVFMGAQALQGIDLPTVGRLLQALTKLGKAAEQAVGARDVRVHGMGHCTVWAGRDIMVQEKAAGCTLYCGRDIRSPETAVFTQADLVAGGEVAVGLLQSVRGTAPVTVRAGVRVQVEEVQAGCVFEFGADQKEIKSDQQALIAGPNAKGQLIFKHRD